MTTKMQIKVHGLVISCKMDKLKLNINLNSHTTGIIFQKYLIVYLYSFKFVDYYQLQWEIPKLQTHLFLLSLRDVTIKIHTVSVSKPFPWSTDLTAQLTQYPFSFKESITSQVIDFKCSSN